MPPESALHDYISNYTSDLDQGGLKLSGTAVWVNHWSSQPGGVPPTLLILNARRGRYPR